MNIKNKVDIYLHIDKYDDERFYANTSDMSEYGHVLVCKKTFELTFDAPDDFDPIKSQVSSLEAEKARVEAESYAKVKNIDEQIQRLVCIEHKE